MPFQVHGAVDRPPDVTKRLEPADRLRELQHFEVGEGRHLDNLASPQKVREPVVLVGEPAHRERRDVVPRPAGLLREPAVPDEHVARPIQFAHRVCSERDVEPGPHARIRDHRDAGALGVGVERMLLPDDAGVPAEIHQVRAD